MARGVIVEQPLTFMVKNPIENEKPISLNVSTTKIRALIQIDTILAPNCVIPHHRQSLKNIQNGEGSFNAVVSMSSLRTRSDKEYITVTEPLELRNIQKIHPIEPPTSLTTEDAEGDNANLESDDEDSIEGDTGEAEINISESAIERSSGFTQQPTDVLP